MTAIAHPLGSLELLTEVIRRTTATPEQMDQVVLENVDLIDRYDEGEPEAGTLLADLTMVGALYLKGLLS